jgi:glycerophosphoryl diester phosphodiesterase
VAVTSSTSIANGEVSWRDSASGRSNDRVLRRGQLNVKIFASQGYHHEFRENTINAFAAAVALGVDGVEFDVRRTLDGVLVVHHDAVVEGMTVAATRQSDLPTYIPTLAQSLLACRGVEINIDIKNYRHRTEPTYDDTGSFAHDVVTVIHDCDVGDHVLVSCFDVKTCATIRSRDGDLRVGWLLWDVSVTESLATATNLGLHAVNPLTTAVNEHDVRTAHSAGVAVYAWTGSVAADVEVLTRWDIDSLITDDPVGALRHRGRLS